LLNIEGVDLGGGCRGGTPPPPPTKKKKSYFKKKNIKNLNVKNIFIGVEVEQETSALPTKKNPGSAPV